MTIFITVTYWMKWLLRLLQELAQITVTVVITE